ncbi:unnamed protein product [Chironomus riparius]|uniref:Uncharacterized protein n=1 Tax=Chironomus riparius TaxID=315576 RepID=A0A9N9RJR7_9DIPT|nr:unnamed protein product [Chironomus riparius]
MLKVTGCFCFDLETGAKIIGWLGLFRSAFLPPTTFFAVLEIQKCLKNPQPSITSLGEHKSCILVNNFDLLGVSPIYSIPILISIALYILLLVGINNRNQNYIIPVIFKIFIGIAFEGIILLFAISILSLSDPDVFQIFIAVVIECLLSLYFAAVLAELYKKIKLDEPPSYNVSYSYVNV